MRLPQAPALADDDPARRAVALGDYRRYLRLAVCAPALAPGAAIDLTWHTHMCLPARYAADMRALGGFIDHRPCSEDYPADPRWLDNSREVWKTAFGPDAIFPGEYTGIVKCCCSHVGRDPPRERLTDALHVELAHEWADALAAGEIAAVATAMVDGLEEPGRAWNSRGAAPKYAKWANEANGVGNTPEAAAKARIYGDTMVSACVKRIAMRDLGLTPWLSPHSELDVPGHAESSALKQSVPHATLAALMRAVAGSPELRRTAALRVLTILGLSLESFPPWEDAELRALRAAADGMTGGGGGAAACTALPEALVAIVDEELAARDPLRAASLLEAPKTFCPVPSCELM